jgi:hypothetical protein
MLQEFLASDSMLVLFSVALGVLIGMFGERVRHERADDTNCHKD